MSEVSETKAAKPLLSITPKALLKAKELLAKLGVGKGDTIYAIDQPDGIRLTTADPDFEAQMVVARKLMKRWRNVLRELAK